MGWKHLLFDEETNKYHPVETGVEVWGEPEDEEKAWCEGDDVPLLTDGTPKKKRWGCVDCLLMLAVIAALVLLGACIAFIVGLVMDGQPKFPRDDSPYGTYEECPLGWWQENERCVTSSSTSMTLEEAEEFCSRRDAVLAYSPFTLKFQETYWVNLRGDASQAPRYKRPLLGKALCQKPKYAFGPFSYPCQQGELKQEHTCYFLSRKAMSYDKASDYCIRARKGALVSEIMAPFSPNGTWFPGDGRKCYATSLKATPVETKCERPRKFVCATYQGPPKLCMKSPRCGSDFCQLPRGNSDEVICVDITKLSHNAHYYWNTQVQDCLNRHYPFKPYNQDWEFPTKKGEPAVDTLTRYETFKQQCAAAGRCVSMTADNKGKGTPYCDRCVPQCDNLGYRYDI